MMAPALRRSVCPVTRRGCPSKAQAPPSALRPSQAPWKPLSAMPISAASIDPLPGPHNWLLSRALDRPLPWGASDCLCPVTGHTERLRLCTSMGTGAVGYLGTY